MTEPLTHAIQNRDVNSLCQAYFDADLYPTQEDIVQSIAFREDRRIIINTYTRYGKTYSVGLGLGLYILFNNSKNIRIGILGAQKSDATKLRKDMLKAGMSSPEFKALIDSSIGRDPEDMLKSSKADQMTFADGNIELKCLSAQSASNHGDQAGAGSGSGLMGEGFDLLILEESTQIDHEVWKSYASRLLEESTSVLVELGNPWHKDNQFYQHWNSPEFTKFHVDEEKGIEEGRHSKAWFDEKANELGGRQTLEYKVLYRAEFPDQVESALIRHSWIDKARKQSFTFTDEKKVRYAVDVADEGDDSTVLSRIKKKGTQIKLTHQWELEDSGDTGKTAQWVDKRIQYTDDKEEVDDIVVDYVGIGAGVWSKLNELGYRCHKFKAGENPLNEKDRFHNKKARNYFKLRDALQDEDVQFSDRIGSELVQQLTHIKTDRTSRDKVKIKDPSSGSPDFADSFMMTFYRGESSKVSVGSVRAI